MVITLKRVAFHVTSAVANTARRVVERWAFASAPRTDALGIQLQSFGQVRDSHELFAKITESLELIASVEPRRFRRLSRDIRRIVVTPFARANAAYLPKSRTCYVSHEIAKKHSVANVAILLVHEATHARFEVSGVRHWPDRRARFERACVRAELAFADQLPRAQFPNIDSWIERRTRTSAALRGEPPG
jgi:hypothetical protein